MNQKEKEFVLQLVETVVKVHLYCKNECVDKGDPECNSTCHSNNVDTMLTDLLTYHSGNMTPEKQKIKDKCLHIIAVYKAKNR